MERPKKEEYKMFNGAIQVFNPRPYMEALQKYIDYLESKEEWISVEDRLPEMLAVDFINKGYTELLVKLKDGTHGVSQVTDPNTWKYIAEECGVTHWKYFNHQ